MNVQPVSLDLIRTDGGTQPRASISETMIEAYAEDMTNGAEFPPLIVFHDGAEYWLADGFHRFFAAKGCDIAELSCDVRSGTCRDAILFSVSANASHGLRRSNEDKRKAVLTLLKDEKWSQNTDQWIAEACHVGRAFVGKMRASIMPSDSMMEPAPVVRKFTRNGKTYEMNVAKIGSGASKSRPLTEAEASLVAKTSAETVYLLSTGERVKIGFTRHGAKHRVEQLLTSTPSATVIAVAEGSIQKERDVHGLLQCDRDAGEWFVCSVDEALAAMREAGLTPILGATKADPVDQAERAPSLSEQARPSPMQAMRRDMSDNGPIFSDLRELFERFHRLPSADDAARRMPASLRHAFTAQQFRDAADYFGRLAEAWARENGGSHVQAAE